MFLLSQQKEQGKQADIDGCIRKHTRYDELNQNSHIDYTDIGVFRDQLQQPKCGRVLVHC